MKKLKLILVTLLSLLLLAACGSKKSSGEVTTDPSTLAKQLAEETVTSDTLSEVSTDIMASTYFVDTTNRGFQRLHEHRRFCLRGRCHQMQ